MRETDHREGHNQDYVSNEITEGCPISAPKFVTLSNEILDIAHCYMLFNTSFVEPYME